VASELPSGSAGTKLAGYGEKGRRALTWLRGLLAHMLSFHGPDAPAKHDGLDPLTPLAVGELETQGAGEAGQHWLPKLVAVIRSPITGLNGDLQRQGEVPRILETWVLPGQIITWKESTKLAGPLRQDTEEPESFRKSLTKPPRTTHAGRMSHFRKSYFRKM